MNLRSGCSTGSCAAAAAAAAAELLAGGVAPTEIDLALPDGGSLRLPIESARRDGNAAEAAVRKDAGDDPDVTHGALVVVRLEPQSEGDLEFAAGEGVGRVTRPGLAVPPGEPAINPVPRRMIRHAVRDRLAGPLRVTVSIPGGEALARKTFNPRLGVEGGLSILGTSGRVRPYSHEALADAVACAVDVAVASGATRPALVPGNLGRKALLALYDIEETALVEVSNAWGAALDRIAAAGDRVEALLASGHPGKLAKLAAGDWDTHSARSEAAVGPVAAWCRECLGAAPESGTVEGLFAALAPEARRRFGDALAERVRLAVEARARRPVGVVLTALDGALLGEVRVNLWRRRA